MVSALLISPGENGTNAGLPDSSALIAPFSRGMSAMVSSLRQMREQLVDAVCAWDQLLFRSIAHQHRDGRAVRFDAVRHRLVCGCLRRVEQAHQFVGQPGM